MNRYIHSFIISSIFYISIIIGVVYFLSIDDSSKADANIKATKKVCFSVVTQVEIPEPKVEKKPEPKPKPKPKPKPEPKPKPKPLPEPIKEEPIPQPTPEPIVEETIKEETEVVEEQTQEVIKSEEIATETKNKISPEVVQAQQDLFISHLIHKINSNKSYPNMARRRGIEGLVDVKFKILSNGNVEDIKIISGRSIFKKSATEAITRSFPVVVKDSMFEFPREFKVKITYILK